MICLKIHYCKMFVLVLLILSLFANCESLGELNLDQEPQYVLNFESQIYVTGGKDYIDTSKVMCERYNETTAVMYGEIEFLKEMGQGLILDVILKKEASGKHEVMFSHDICDLCKELGDDESDYKKYLQFFGIPKSCPFDAGEFDIANLIVDMSDFDIKDQQCGEYLAELFMYKSTGENCKSDRELLFTLKLDLSIERC